MDDIIDNSSIQVPSYLDDSDTTKVLYALGINDKPTVVSDSQLDNMPGTEIYRTVYESGSMPPPSSDAILDQIRHDDYTQMSGEGGSVHGKAVYFATKFKDSAAYGDKDYSWHPKTNVMIARAKINPNAKIVSEYNLSTQMTSKGFTSKTQDGDNRISLYAISQGIDGWYSGTYTMIVNRKNLTMSDQNRRISKRNIRGQASNTAKSWSEAAIAR